MSKPSKALREYLRELGRRGGKASAGRGVRDAWPKIPPAGLSGKHLSPKLQRERLLRLRMLSLDPLTGLTLGRVVRVRADHGRVRVDLQHLLERPRLDAVADAGGQDVLLKPGVPLVLLRL